MKQQTSRYRDGPAGFLGEFRWFFGLLAGVVVSAMTSIETNSTEIGFLGMFLWLHFLLGALAAGLVVMVLKSIGMRQDDEADLDV